MNTWTKTIKIGERAEDEFLKIIKKIDIKSYKTSGFYGDYDIRATGLTFEVKKDELAHRTGNLAVEYRYKNEPSGISITKADVFAIMTDNDLYLFKTEKLKDFIKINWKYLRKTRGGDNNKSDLVLISLNDVDKVASLITKREQIDTEGIKFFIDTFKKIV